MSVWNTDNIRDWAEAVGIPNCDNDVVDALCGDVEFRISQILEEALKSMRHSKRNVLYTQDISIALRTLDIEPLYGYEATRPLRFGEASIGPGKPLYYVEDEEVDFEKLINAPLPKIPREIAFTAHWLAIEGVQPSIPQNPSTTATSHQDLLPKSQHSTTSGLSAGINGVGSTGSVSVKPLTKHVLSQELLLYFSKLSSALLDEFNDEYRSAALASLRSEPGLHQLVPYFVQFVADKVTHNIKSIFILTAMMHLVAAMLENPHLYLDPYISALIPSILTCLIGRNLGPSIITPSSSSSAVADHLATYPLRDLAASILKSITKKYSSSSHTLKPRLARTCLKHFLDPSKPLATNYGGIIGLLQSIGGNNNNSTEVTRSIIIPNLKTFGDLILKDAFATITTTTTTDGLESSGRRKEAELIMRTLVKAVADVDISVSPAGRTGGVTATQNGEGEALVGRLREGVGDTVAEKVLEIGGAGVVEKLVRLLDEEEGVGVGRM